MISLPSEFKFVDRGFKKTLVLVPGWATDEKIFSKLDLDYNYLFCSRPEPDNFGKQLLDALLKYSLLKASILGLSMGGFLAAEFSIQNPDKINEVFLVGVRKKYPQDGIRDIEEKIKKNKKAYLYKFYEACFFGASSSVWQDFRDDLLDSYVNDMELEVLLSGLDYLSKVQLKAERLKDISVLSFFHSPEDKVAPYAEAQALYSELPRARFVTLKDSGHIPFFNPEFKDKFNG